MRWRSLQKYKSRKVVRSTIDFLESNRCVNSTYLHLTGINWDTIFVQNIHQSIPPPFHKHSKVAKLIIFSIKKDRFTDNNELQIAVIERFAGICSDYFYRGLELWSDPCNKCKEKYKLLLLYLTTFIFADNLRIEGNLLCLPYRRWSDTPKLTRGGFL